MPIAVTIVGTTAFPTVGLSPVFSQQLSQQLQICTYSACDGTGAALQLWAMSLKVCIVCEDCVCDRRSELVSACWVQIQGLPTMIFIGTDNNKPALRTEGLLPAETIKNIIAKEL